ncbi:MAG: hypothetical protein ABI183_24065 [Polyangiaceae bacterium]
MVLGRGFVVSLLFAVGWLALVVDSRPPVVTAGAETSAIRETADELATWSFTPALVPASERARFRNANDANEARAAIVSADQAIGTRLVVSALLTLLGLVAFWAGVRLIVQKKSTPLAVVLIALGPALPCVVAMGPAGFLLSGPPLTAGVMIAAITLVLQQFQKPAS